MGFLIFAVLAGLSVLLFYRGSRESARARGGGRDRLFDKDALPWTLAGIAALTSAAGVLAFQLHLLS